LTGGTTSTGAFQSIASVGTSGQVLTSNGAGALPTFQAAASGGISTVTGQRFTATGAFTYTPTANMKYVIVELCGAGGGSGGSGGAANTVCGAAGGGGGAYARFILTAAQVGASLTGSVGAGGTAATAGNNAGGTGGSTTLATTSAWTAAGGVGGAGTAGANSVYVIAVGGAGGTVTTGTGTILNSTNGTAGLYGIDFTNLVAWPGVGGSSAIGVGAQNILAVAAGTSTGVAGVQPGAGASGSYSFNTNGNVAGSAGAAGIAIFTEFV